MDKLISKKELLDITGISYGQLYRWKRKNIIPEQWFIKKSAYTGQETFFPRDKILDRIEQIKLLKDSIPLDEMADYFNLMPNVENNVTIDDLVESGKISKFIVTACEDLIKTCKTEGDKIFILTFGDKLLNSNKFSLDEAKSILELLLNNYEKLTEDDYFLHCIRNMGLLTSILSKDIRLYTDKNSMIIEVLDISNHIDSLRGI